MPVHHTAYVEVTENLQLSVLSFNHVGLEDLTQASRLDDKDPLPLSHPTSISRFPIFIFSILNYMYFCVSKCGYVHEPA